jgi:solute:Na+ symporter, SSS family
VSGLDWAVVLVYFAVIGAIGLYAGRRNARLEDFFLAGREMPWWAVGLSVMATQISAITFIGTTGQAYVDGMRFLVVYFGLPIAMVILCATLVPFYFKAHIFTAYEYLERRFDSTTRTLTSLLFLCSRGLSVGVTLYAPSLVLSVVLGWSETATILAMGGTTVLYVIYGGSRSVIWTDVVQMAVIWVGIFVCVGVAILHLPETVSLRDALALGQAAGRLRVIDPSPSVYTPYTLWEGLIAGTFLALSYFGCDQSQVQRYLASRDLTQSRLSLLFNAALKIPMQFLILLTGVMIFVFYHFHPVPLLWNPVQLARLERRIGPAEVGRLQQQFDAAHQARREAAQAFLDAGDRRPELAEAYRRSNAALVASRAEAEAAAREGGKPYNDTNYIFPTYVLTHLPKGIAGLVIAVIFAAAMSTLSGEFNSLASATMIDFYRRFVGGADANAVAMSRLFTAMWGLFACVVALRAGQLGSVIEVVNRFGSFFYGPILGVFGLAVLTRRATGPGASIGLVCGLGGVATVSILTNVHFLWYNVIGAAIVFVVGLLLSFPQRSDASSA